MADGLFMVHGFGNVGFVQGRGEVLVVDVSSPMTASMALGALRKQTEDRICTIVYSHGHFDHCGGIGRFLDDAEQRGHAPPEIWAHQNVLSRFARYERTRGWNDVINLAQFGLDASTRLFPETHPRPNHTYAEREVIELSEEPVLLRHAEGETNDATWVWLPERRAALVGDLVIHSLPNLGNPNKPRRYTLGWAEALDAIASERPDHLIPGHGDPVSGDLVLELLTETARALRYLHDAVVDRLNAGQWPDEIVDADLQLPDDLAQKPYLQPIYGCASFVVQELLREHAGWWGGDPARLFPATRHEAARDLVELAGREAVQQRAAALLDEGEIRRALHLAVLSWRANPDGADGKKQLVQVLEAAIEAEPSFIAQSFLRQAIRQVTG
ncbi:MAG: MBL fold metallo-hydrolase [Deltaproteobacteria bacterium]|nr:MBL fold metallo-hydrolase [Deltaproteobacteria bacterium]